MSDVPKLPFLPDAHHYAIAAVATRAAQLDHMVQGVVDFELGHNRRETARFLLGSLSMDRVIGLLQALLHDDFADETAAIDDLIKRINAARGERNRILHWLWDKSEAVDTAVLVKISLFGEHQYEDKTAADIQAVADDLLGATTALIVWHQRILEKMREKTRNDAARIFGLA